jgi:hypothetical protein
LACAKLLSTKSVSLSFAALVIFYRLYRYGATVVIDFPFYQAFSKIVLGCHQQHAYQTLKRFV